MGNVYNGYSCITIAAFHIPTRHAVASMVCPLFNYCVVEHPKFLQFNSRADSHATPLELLVLQQESSILASKTEVTE